MPGSSAQSSLWRALEADAQAKQCREFQISDPTCEKTESPLRLVAHKRAWKPEGTKIYRCLFVSMKLEASIDLEPSFIIINRRTTHYQYTRISLSLHLNIRVAHLVTVDLPADPPPHSRLTDKTELDPTGLDIKFLELRRGN